MSDDQKQYPLDDSSSQNDNHTPIPHLVSGEPDDEMSYSPTKEGEPMRMDRVENTSTVESVASEDEPTVEDSEVEKYVEVMSEEPTIHPDLKKAGLQTIDTSSLDPKQRIHLPISDDKVMVGLEQPISSSFRWLAEVAFFMLKRAHITLKKLHGHVVRVIQK